MIIVRNITAGGLLTWILTLGWFGYNLQERNFYYKKREKNQNTLEIPQTNFENLGGN